MNKTGEPRSSSKRGKLPPLKTSTTQAYKKLRNIKDENYSGSIEVKNWMKSMVEMSLKLGNDLSYIKGVMLKNREKEKLEKNLLKIRKNIKIVKLRGRPRRRGLTNSFLKRSSMQRLGQHNYSEFSNGQSHKYGQLRQNQSIEDIYSRMNHSNIISNRNSAFKRYQRSELTENNNNFSIQGKFLLSDQDFSKEGSEMNNEGEGKKEPIDTLIEMIDQAKELKSKIRNDLIKKEIPQHEKFKRLRRLLRQKLIELGKMGLSLEEYQKHEIFPKKPFLRPGSYELIEAAKMDDLDTLKKILADNPYLVYDYDHIGLTAMHWACKRNNNNVAFEILRHKPNLFSTDLLNRPSLYFAILNQNFELVRAMLLKKANPWSSTLDVDYIHLCKKDVRIISLIQKFRNIEMLSSMSEVNDRKKIWDRETQMIQFAVNNDY